MSSVSIKLSKDSKVKLLWGVIGIVGWGFDRSVGPEVDIANTITFVLDDGSELVSSNKSLILWIMETSWVSF